MPHLCKTVGDLTTVGVLVAFGALVDGGGFAGVELLITWNLEYGIGMAYRTGVCGVDCPNDTAGIPGKNAVSFVDPGNVTRL